MTATKKHVKTITVDSFESESVMAFLTRTSVSDHSDDIEIKILGIPTTTNLVITLNAPDAVKNLYNVLRMLVETLFPDDNGVRSADNNIDNDLDEEEFDRKTIDLMNAETHTQRAVARRYLLNAFSAALREIDSLQIALSQPSNSDIRYLANAAHFVISNFRPGTEKERTGIDQLKKALKPFA